MERVRKFILPNVIDPNYIEYLEWLGDNQQAKIDKLEEIVKTLEIGFLVAGAQDIHDCIDERQKLKAQNKELVEALMRIAFEVPCCAREEAREVLVKIKKRGLR